MDELAHKLGIDPIELRRRNEPNEDESNNLPFSTRRLRECYTVGAREFGWHRRNPRPRSTRDGDWLIGMGMAAGVYDTARIPAEARARLDADGTAVVEAATSDMGPGTYTSQTQVAADALGLTMRTVTFRLGDSLYPPTPPHGGSPTMASVGSAVLDACDKVRRQAIKLAVEDRESPLYGVDADDVVVRGGRLHVQGTRRAVRRTGACWPATTAPTWKRDGCLHGAADAPSGTPSTPTTRPSPRSPSTRRSVWCGCGGCSACTTRAASSAPSSPTARRSAASWAASARPCWSTRSPTTATAGSSTPTSPTTSCPSTPTSPTSGRSTWTARTAGRPARGQGTRRGRPGRAWRPPSRNAVFNATGRRVRELPITAEALL